MNEYTLTDLDKYTTRGSSLIPFALRDTPITIVGCGGIGSWAAVCLARMGACDLTLVDPDTVAEENIGPQHFVPGDIGRAKVYALTRHVAEITMPREPRAWVERIETPGQLAELTYAGGVVISTPDSMRARRTVFEGALGAGARWLIDGRMGGAEYRAYCCDLHDPADVSRYEKTLYSDEDTVALPCTARATAYTGLGAGGLIGSMVAACVGGGARPPSLVAWETAQWGGFTGVRYGPGQ